MRRLAVSTALLAAAGCSAPPPLPSGSFQLAELADTARLVVETDAVDFGNPAQRPALWSGWGADETYPGGTFVWGAGEKSRLRLDVVEPRDRTLRLRGWSYPFGDAPPQEVRVEVRGNEVGRRKLAATPGWMELELPGDLLRVGENFLELRYERRAEGPIPRAAGWDLLRFDDPRAGGAPRIDRGTGRIVLPARTAVEWTLELAGDSWISWKTLATSGGAELAISITGEDDRREELPRTRRGRLRLTRAGEPYRLHTISFRAVGASGEVRLTGLRLHAADLAAAAAASAAAAPDTSKAQRTRSSPPNIVLYVVDTLRPDHLGCYGYPKPISPAIDEFARGAVRFREARAQAPWTRPAMASILTGLYPIAHQAQRMTDRLPERVETLAERFAAAGWQTALITTHGEVARRYGFAQGFARFSYLTEPLRPTETHVRSSEANRVALDWLDRRDPSRPFFLVLHTTDPLDPYTPAPEFRRRFAADVADRSLGSRSQMARLDALAPAEAALLRAPLMALYDAEVAQNDESFGRLRAELARRGLDRATAVVLTSDHGEEFAEHGGWKHGRTLYEEQLRIPLLLSVPGRNEALVVPEPVEQVDIVPTLLELAGLSIPRSLPGRSLVPLAEGRRVARAGRTQYAWLETQGLALEAATRSEWKLIANRIPGDPLERAALELYSLGSDQEERHDLALRRTLRRHWLEAQLARVNARYRAAAGAERTEIDPELKKTLETLGYL